MNKQLEIQEDGDTERDKQPGIEMDREGERGTGKVVRKLNKTFDQFVAYLSNLTCLLGKEWE